VSDSLVSTTTEPLNHQTEDENDSYRVCLGGGRGVIVCRRSYDQTAAGTQLAYRLVQRRSYIHPYYVRPSVCLSHLISGASIILPHLTYAQGDVTTTTYYTNDNNVSRRETICYWMAV